MRQRVLLISEHLDELCCGETSESNGAQVEIMKKLAWRAVDGILTKRQQECVEMYYYEGKSLKEISAVLGIDSSTISRHLKAARRRLEKLRALM